MGGQESNGKDQEEQPKLKRTLYQYNSQSYCFSTVNIIMGKPLQCYVY